MCSPLARTPCNKCLACTSSPQILWPDGLRQPPVVLSSNFSCIVIQKCRFFVDGDGRLNLGENENGETFVTDIELLLLNGISLRKNKLAVALERLIFGKEDRVHYRAGQRPVI